LITVWRITKLKYADSAYSGEGARLVAGRWHEAGQRVVYTSSSAALAALEVLVHTDTDLLPRTPFVAIPATLPTRLKLLRLTSEDLPAYWNALPSPSELRERGTKWLREGKTAVLAVPSVIVPFEWNYLLNPAHPDFSKIQIGEPREYRFDPRLSQR
jgi:RES domain-containing protein